MNNTTNGFYQCKRCGYLVNKKRCQCAVSPSPWELISDEQYHKVSMECYWEGHEAFFNKSKNPYVEFTIESDGWDSGYFDASFGTGRE
jgi:predicted ATP-dependent serine protease